MKALFWGCYLVAAVILITVIWIRVGEWDANHEELQDRNRRP